MREVLALLLCAAASLSSMEQGPPRSQLPTDRLDLLAGGALRGQALG